LYKSYGTTLNDFVDRGKMEFIARRRFTLINREGNLCCWKCDRSGSRKPSIGVRKQEGTIEKKELLGVEQQPILEHFTI